MTWHIKTKPSDPTLLFVHRLVDDCRLTPCEFGVLAHAVRRAGPFSMTGASYSRCRRSLRDIADVRGMSVNTVSKVLARFVDLNVFEKSPPRYPGEPCQYQVSKFRDWNLKAMGAVKCTVTAKDQVSDSCMLFVHSDIDEFGFTPHQFRVLCHLTGRAGTFSRLRRSEGYCYAGIRSMANICRMSRCTLCRTIRELRAMNVIQRIRVPGRFFADAYIIRPMIEWVYQSEAQKVISETNPIQGDVPSVPSPEAR